MFQAIRKKSEQKARDFQKAAPSDGAKLEGDSLFEALICEFHWTALQTGGVSQFLNATTDNRDTWALNGCIALMPSQSLVIGLALKSWDSICLQEVTAQNLASFHLDLGDANSHTERTLALAASKKPPMQSELEILQLAAIWRELARNARNVVLELESDISRRLPTEYGRNTIVLAKVLSDAAKGDAALVDSQGYVTLPRLSQRRREHRFTMVQSCRIFKRSGTSNGTVRDVSRGGMRLVSSGNFVLHEQVIVELSNGRRFAGLVVWTNDGQQGIQFVEPINYADPVFR